MTDDFSNHNETLKEHLYNFYTCGEATILKWFAKVRTVDMVIEVIEKKRGSVSYGRKYLKKIHNYFE